jgi:hypothetical protein
MSYKPLSGKKVFYRIKGVTADDHAFYSNILALQSGHGQPVQVVNTFVNNMAVVNSTGQYTYQLFHENGQLLQSGTLQTGYNTLTLQTGAKGMLLMRIFDGTRYWSEKLIRQ